MLIADGHALIQIDSRVVHAQAQQCHQYFTVIGQSVAACDGCGNPEPRPSVSNRNISERVAGAIRRLLASNEKETQK